jgi:hypothetical protein
MAENRWQIAIGAVLLLLMLLVGTFSLGVYIGRHGLSREGLSYQPAQVANPQILQQSNRPEGIPEGNPQLVGRLRSATRQGIELITQNGIRFIAINQETKLLNETGETLERSDFHAGDLLAIFGEFSINEGNQLLAEVVIRVPQQQPPQP